MESPRVDAPSGPGLDTPAFCEPSVRNWAVVVAVILVVGSWPSLLLPSSFPIEFIVLPSVVLGLSALFGLYWAIREDFFLSPERVLFYRRLFFFGPLVAFVLLFQIFLLRFPVRHHARSESAA